MAQRPARVLKFVSAALEERSRTCCRARVAVELEPNVTLVGLAETQGKCSEMESLQCVAQATAQALLQAVGKAGDTLDATGVSLTTPLGKKTLFVMVSAHYQGQDRELMGFCVMGSDPVRTAALAVLNATNRFLGLG